MAYKKYVYRNGRKVGPYYYESYRDADGKVKKRYIGPVKRKRTLTYKKKKGGLFSSLFLRKK